MTKNYYVYEYFDPETDKVFYIGKGRENRIYTHTQHFDSGGRSKKIKQLLKKYKPVDICRKIRTNLTELEAFSLEAIKIEHYGLDMLTNKVAGLLPHKRVSVDGEDVCIMGSYEEYKAYKYEIEKNVTSKILKLHPAFKGGNLAQHGWHVEKDNYININNVSFKLTVVVQLNTSRIQLDAPKKSNADIVIKKIADKLNVKPADNTMYSRVYIKNNVGARNPEELSKLLEAITYFTNVIDDFFEVVDHATPKYWR